MALTALGRRRPAVTTKHGGHQRVYGPVYTIILRFQAIMLATALT
jgi:hypothetical protein